MAIYTIIRVYEVPAEAKQQTTERLLEALVFHVEADFHVKDIIREPGQKPGQGKAVDTRSWWTGAGKFGLPDSAGYNPHVYSRIEKGIGTVSR